VSTPLKTRILLADDHALVRHGLRLVLNAASRLGLTELRVKGLSWPCRLSVRYRPDAYLSPAARRFIELLKATAKERS
jgi:hypothetical protein